MKPQIISSHSFIPEAVIRKYHSGLYMQTVTGVIFARLL